MRRNIFIGLLVCCAGCATQVNEAGDTGSSCNTAAGKAARNVPVRQQKKVEVPDDAFAATSEAIDALCVAADNEDGETVRIAEVWLLRQGSRPVTPLASIILDENGDVAHRVVSCRVLRKMGDAAKPVWKKALNCASKQIRINAMRGLAGIKPQEEATLKALAAVLNESDDTLRSEAAATLAEIGPPAANASTDQLLAIVNDDTETNALRDAAKRALKAVTPRHTLAD